ncbi:MAG TPA: phosphodiester glycosidase family protein [Armatimonadota bacterium]|jgi:hypothetical protein
MKYAVTIALFLLCWLPLHAEMNSIRAIKTTIGDVTVNAAYIDLHDPSLLVTPGVALDAPNNRKSFRDFLDESDCLVQTTGAFFDLQNGEPVGDIVVRGKSLFVTSRIGSALIVTKGNVPAIVDGPYGPFGWVECESVLQGGVRVLRRGQVAVDPASQGFHDRYMQRCTSRIAVGVMNHHVVMVQTGRVLLPELANIMLQLGCTDAMALDGGGSTGFAVNGKCIISTERKLANVLMVVRRTPEEMFSKLQESNLRELLPFGGSVVAEAYGWESLGLYPPL